MTSTNSSSILKIIYLFLLSCFLEKLTINAFSKCYPNYCFDWIEKSIPSSNSLITFQKECRQRNEWLLELYNWETINSILNFTQYININNYYIPLNLNVVELSKWKWQTGETETQEIIGSNDQTLKFAFFNKTSMSFQSGNPFDERFVLCMMPGICAWNAEWTYQEKSVCYFKFDDEVCDFFDSSTMCNSDFHSGQLASFAGIDIQKEAPFGWIASLKHDAYWVGLARSEWTWMHNQIPAIFFHWDDEYPAVQNGKFNSAVLVHYGNNKNKWRNVILPRPDNEQITLICMSSNPNPRVLSQVTTLDTVTTGLIIGMVLCGFTVLISLLIILILIKTKRLKCNPIQQKEEVDRAISIRINQKNPVENIRTDVQSRQLPSNNEFNEYRSRQIVGIKNPSTISMNVSSKDATDFKTDKTDISSSINTNQAVQIASYDNALENAAVPEKKSAKLNLYDNNLNNNEANNDYSANYEELNDNFTENVIYKKSHY